MPVTWAVRWPILRVTLSERYELDDVERAVDKALADPACREGILLLLDTRLAKVNPTQGLVHARARWLDSLPARGVSRRGALVVGPELFQYGLARMMSAYLESVQLGIFQEIDAAENWLLSAQTGAMAGSR
jgi:hypothetical protein